MVALRRIVRMQFRENGVETFLKNFAEASPKIRAFEGCLHLELWQDPDDSTIFMTYSHWENADALEVYRHSELFRATWAKTKPLFAAKPIAFSGMLERKL
ncbi:MAG: putative quinol monooxygenase [Bacteroidota bacterium]